MYWPSLINGIGQAFWLRPVAFVIKIVIAGQHNIILTVARIEVRKHELVSVKWITTADEQMCKKIVASRTFEV